MSAEHFSLTFARQFGPAWLDGTQRHVLVRQNRHGQFFVHTRLPAHTDPAHDRIEIAGFFSASTPPEQLHAALNAAVAKIIAAKRR